MLQRRCRSRRCCSRPPSPSARPPGRLPAASAAVALSRGARRGARVALAGVSLGVAARVCGAAATEVSVGVLLALFGASLLQRLVRWTVLLARLVLHCLAGPSLTCGDRSLAPRLAFAGSPSLARLFTAIRCSAGSARSSAASVCLLAHTCGKKEGVAFAGYAD